MTAEFSPAHETLRLSKLQDYDILDTPAEAAYDDIAELAAHICEAPTALVSLIDANRQWFKARIGLDATESPRNVAFCAHTIGQDGVLIVEDTHHSVRFKDNPLVTGEPHIRFYAGAPLVTPDGYALGSLCVIDYVPRKINLHQRQALQILSRQVIAQMELARQREQLKRMNAGLERRVSERTARLTAALQKLLVTQNKLQRREVALRHSALHDPLTGLPNGNYFAQRLAQAIQLANRQPSHLYAVLVIDLDDFKLVNETLGAEVGDRFLKHIAQQIKQMLRKSDLVARLGGDEFAVLLDDISHEDQAITAVERLQTQLKQPFEINHEPVFVGASIGMTFSTQGYRQPEAALRDADVAMHHAKRQTKQRTQKLLESQLHPQNQKDLGPLKSPILIQSEQTPTAQRFAIFDTTLQGNNEARAVLEDELRQAMLTDQFELYYQPILKLPVNPRLNNEIGLETDARSELETDPWLNYGIDYWREHLVGFEVLLRWNHPERGCLEAGEFMAVAEEIGIVRLLCKQTIDTACSHLSQWIALSQRSDLKIHINHSLAEMQSTQLLSHWQSALAAHRLPPDACRVEVNEQLVLSDDPTIRKNIKLLKALGLNLCINDFGRGHSSLSRLHQLEISSLKIDRTLIQQAEIQRTDIEKTGELGNTDESGSADIIKTILDLGRSIDVDVIATGIETAPQLTTLNQLGCKLAQGFWLSRPLTAQAVKNR
ncbi:MAG: EAL domain-containing protein [Cyanobacteria bacterium P01_D01_bin.105]